MNNEKKLQFKVYGRLLIACIFGGLYAYGGMTHKWLRRFIAPLIVQIYIAIEIKSWKYLVQLPFQFLSLSLGYGASELSAKILKRFLFAFANATSFVPHYYCWKGKKWIASVFHIIILISAYIVLGVFNPLPARVEETILGFLIVFIPIMSIHFFDTNV